MVESDNEACLRAGAVSRAQTVGVPPLKGALQFRGMDLYFLLRLSKKSYFFFLAVMFALKPFSYGVDSARYCGPMEDRACN